MDKEDQTKPHGQKLKYEKKKKKKTTNKTLLTEQCKPYVLTSKSLNLLLSFEKNYHVKLSNGSFAIWS